MPAYEGKYGFCTAMVTAGTSLNVQVPSTLGPVASTPPDEDEPADLRYVLEAARNIGHHMDGFRFVSDKSTVPGGQRPRSDG